MILQKNIKSYRKERIYLNLLKDIYYVNVSTIKKAWKSFLKNWPIIFTGFAYTIINISIFALISYLLTGVLGILAGFIVAIVTSSLISNYLYLLANIIKYDKLTFNNFKEGFKYYLWKVYGIFFIAWIFSFLLNNVIGVMSSVASRISTIISILVLIIFNPLPEIIYQKSYSPWESLLYSFNFMKENWLSWLLPNIVFFSILYLTTGRIVNDIFTTHLAYNFDVTVNGFVKYLIGQIVFSFTMIYRGYLFDILSTSNRRKREYMKKYYN